MISDHKDWGAIENCLIANNIVMRLILAEGLNINKRKNYIIGHDNHSQLIDIFVNTAAFDLNLLITELTSECAIDKGEKIDDLVSSEIDKDQNSRALPPDLGACEVK